MKERASQTGCGMQTAELLSRSSTEQGSTSDCSFSRKCNGIMGVPITFLDKYNPDEFEIVGMDLNNSVEELGIKEIGNEWVELYKKQGGKGHITASMHSLV